MRDWGWQRILLVALVILVFLGGVAGGLAWWYSTSNQKSADRYKDQVSSDWKQISGKMSLVTAALTRVTSPEDLASVAADADSMSADIAKISSKLEQSRSPRGYGETVEKEKQALKELAAYLSLLSELVRSDAATVASERATLEDRARKAHDRVTSFLSSAPWLEVKLPGDFYQGGQTLQTAYQPVDPALEAEKQAVYDTVKAFMDADIYRRDYDQIWSMLSNRLYTGFQYFNVTKEKLMQGWTAAWGSKRPVSYYISRAQIAFPSQDNATVKAIAYVENGDPRIEEIRLVKEGGVWRIDSYPFVGWL